MIIMIISRILIDLVNLVIQKVLDHDDDEEKGGHDDNYDFDYDFSIDGDFEEI